MPSFIRPTSGSFAAASGRRPAAVTLESVCVVPVDVDLESGLPARGAQRRLGRSIGLALPRCLHLDTPVRRTRAVAVAAGVALVGIGCFGILGPQLGYLTGSAWPPGHGAAAAAEWTLAWVGLRVGLGAGAALLLAAAAM